MTTTPKTIPIAGFKGAEIKNIRSIDDVKTVLERIVKELDYMFRHVRDDAVQTETTLGAHAAQHEVGGSDAVNHDSLTGFVGGEHVNHSAVSILAGTGMSGGGTIEASRTLDCTITQYTDEAAQDAVGGILADSVSVDFTYDDATGTITADVIPGGVDHDQLLNFATNEHFTEASIDHANIQNKGTNTHAQIDTHIGNGSIHVPAGSVAGQHLKTDGGGASQTLSWENPPSASTYLAPRVSSTTSGATLQPAPESYDMYIRTAQAAALEIQNHTGTPDNGQKLIIRIKDDGTARAITYGSYYRSACSVSLPSTTTVSKVLYLGFIWNVAETKWDMVAVSEEA